MLSFCQRKLRVLPCTKGRCTAILISMALWTMLLFLFFDQDAEINRVAPPPRARRPPGCSSQHISNCLANPFLRICDKVGVKMYPYYEVTSSGLINDILLIIVFNSPMYELVPMLEFMYRRHFQNILYCGDYKAQSWDYLQRSYFRPLDFAEVKFVAGQLGYMCMMEAVRRDYDVKGYLHLGDDVLLNIWNIRNYPRDVPWFYEKVMVAYRNQTQVEDIWRNGTWWPWASKRWGVIPLSRAWKDLESIGMNGSMEEKTRVNTFLARLAATSGSKMRVYYYPSDVWYLPASEGAEFSKLMEVFLRREVYLEIAIPTVLHGLGLPVKLFPGTYLWYQDRFNFSDKYSPTEVFFHPFKLREYPFLKGGSSLICSKYIAHLQRDWIIAES